MPITKENKTNPKNNPNQTLKLDSLLSKKRDRKEYSKQRYQAKKQEYHQWYLQRKAQKKQQEREQQSKYYEAEAIKILMSLKEYTELNSVKHKIWLDFIWTFKELNKIGISNIIEVMRIRELAENLINDYWTTAKNEIKKGKSWNSLDQDQKDRLIRYWSYEKARKENNYLDTAEQLEKQSQEYLKEVELAKFHEERGKVKCPCYQCQESKRIKSEIKAELFKESQVEKEQCPECNRWVKKLDEESGVCRKCLSKYE
jgi:Na+-transporting NADH:ubiquinone oxidoreductase subunit NqrF